MKIEVEHIEPCKRLLKIEVSQDVVLKEFDEVYKDIRKVANVHGFRVGKAPLDLLKVNYKEEAKKEALKRLVPATCIEAIKEKELLPVNEPAISNIELKEDNILTFHAEVEVEPEVNLKRYKGVKIKKRKIKVADKDVEDALASLQEREAEFVSIEDRPARTGDYIDCDIEYTNPKKDPLLFSSKTKQRGQVDPSPSASGGGSKDSEVIKRNDVRLLLGDSRETPGFSEQLIGSKPGDKKEFSLALTPGDAKSEGVTMSCFKVSVKGVREKRLPKPDDEFAASIGDYKNSEELKSAIRDNIESYNESNIQGDMREQIINDLISNSSFDVPPSLVNKHLDELVKQTRNTMALRGVPKEDINSKEDILKERLKERAVKEIRTFFLLEKVAQNEGITLSEEDVNKEIEFRARESRRSAEKMRTHLEEKGLMDDLEFNLLSKKVMEFLLNNSNIEEVDV